MPNPMIRIHNTETDEIIDREMTKSEFDQLKADQAEHSARLAETQTREAEKVALLERLGITAEEAALLLG